MPTWEAEPRFWLRWRHLTSAQQFAFQRARRLLVAGLTTGQLDPRLRVKRFRGSPGLWELSWAPDGRALFRYGPEQKPGHAHIIWESIGTHDIFKER